MIKKIDKDDLIFFQTISHPIALAETLFHDFDTLGQFDSEKFGKIRMYQFPMLSYDSLFLYDKKLTSEQNDTIKNNLGENYNLGGRLTGKTIISIIVDTAISTFNQVYKWAVISSYDKLHVQEIFEKLINAFENHKVLRIFNVRPLRSPTYKMNFENGCLLESVNMNITGKNPGGQFFGKHIDRHMMEESSFITKDVSSKLLMAQSEKGCVNRFSGMTTFTKSSPMGVIFFDLQNQSKIINLPSYVNPTWNDKKEADSILEFGGRDSIGYQVQIEGKVVEGAESVFDIVRIRQTYLYDKHGHGIPLKAFEVNKESFHRYNEILVLEKPGNADFLGIYADVGEGAAPSEYIVLSRTNKIYKYIYRITTFQLSPDEEETFIRYLVELLSPNILALDHTSGVGKALYSHLAKDFGEHLVGVDFNSNIEIDFEKDEKGDVKYDKNNVPICKQANVVDWSMQCLKDIFYQKKIQCFEDTKFDSQISNVIVKTTKQGKVMYGYKGANHLFQAFQVFSIANWLSEFKGLTPIKRRKPGLGGM